MDGSTAVPRPKPPEPLSPISAEEEESEEPNAEAAGEGGPGPVGPEEVQLEGENQDRGAPGRGYTAAPSPRPSPVPEELQDVFFGAVTRGPLDACGRSRVDRWVVGAKDFMVKGLGVSSGSVSP